MTDPGPPRPADLLFPQRRQSIIDDTCIACGLLVESFDDELSAREYTISGLCQACQDSVFGKDPA